MNKIYKGLIASVVCSFIALPAFAAGRSTNALSPKISPALSRQMKALQDSESLNGEHHLPALVYMMEQANLDKAFDLESKAERGTYVYRALVATARKSQRSLIAWLKAHKLEYKSYHLGNAIAVMNATPDVINEIAARPDVQRVVADPKIRSKMPGTSVLETIEPAPAAIGENVTKVGADRVWREFSANGAGIVVGGQDTGIQWDHPALKNQYRGWKSGSKDGSVDHTYSWHDSISKPLAADKQNSCGYNLKVPCDDNGHGTHTIGTVVGDDGAANKIGMAPGAKWIGCRNMDAGLGAPHTYLECFEFFLAPYPQGGNAATDGKPELAPHVINNSWGCDHNEGCDGSEFLGVLKSLEAAGIMVVASAGNSGPNCGTIESAPAHHTDETLSVGAIDHRTDNIAGFSSRGPSLFDNGVGPDVTAPGVNVRSCIPGNSYAGMGWSGTSMAGPHVVGQVALMWSAAPGLSGKVRDTVELIRATAQAKSTTQVCGNVPGTAVPNNVFGYGIINAFESVKAAKAKFGE
jgi:subtilisin family serine protease